MFKSNNPYVDFIVIFVILGLFDFYIYIYIIDTNSFTNIFTNPFHEHCYAHLYERLSECAAAYRHKVRAAACVRKGGRNFFCEGVRKECS